LKDTVYPSIVKQALKLSTRLKVFFDSLSCVTEKVTFRFDHRLSINRLQRGKEKSLRHWREFTGVTIIFDREPHSDPPS
jgi:hypothetical protein